MTPGASEHIGQIGGGWWGCGFDDYLDFDDDLRLETSVQKTNVCGGVADWEGFDLGGVGCEVRAETESVSERDLAPLASGTLLAGAARSTQNTLIKVAIDTDGDLSKADWDSIVSDYALNQSVSALSSATSTGLGSMAGSGGGEVGRFSPNNDKDAGGSDLAGLKGSVF